MVGRDRKGEDGSERSVRCRVPGRARQASPSPIPTGGSCDCLRRVVPAVVGTEVSRNPPWDPHGSRDGTRGDMSRWGIPHWGT